MDITRYGITTIWEGDYCYNLPRWAQDEDGLDYANKHLLHAGGNGIYSFPLSSIEINELVDCIAYFMECDNVEMTEKEEKNLRKALESPDPEQIEKLDV